MAIQLEQLQARSDARNPAQWEWRVVDRECHMAGNSPILNLKFGRVIRPARTYRGLRRTNILSKAAQWRAVGRKKYVGRRRSI